MKSDSPRQRPRRRSPRPLDMPQQPPLYAQNPLGVPQYTPAGWSRRPWRQWSRAGRWSFVALVVTLALPLVLAVIAHLLGA
ncbi:MAG: hypothetical protein ACXWQR_17580 [Ktedonobacterales bacterium]